VLHCLIVHKDDRCKSFENRRIWTLEL
jgi:hypothetical protein